MSNGKDRNERIRANWNLQGGRPQRRTDPEVVPEELTGGPGKRADEKILSLPVDEILPDRYQGRLRWPIPLEELEKLYRGEWTAQETLDAIARHQQNDNNPAISQAWEATLELARSILSEGQVAPITVSPARDLPPGYRFVIETGEGRYWAYQLVRWLRRHDPRLIQVPLEEWKEDPAYIRAVAILQPSRLRQVAENEQRQSYPSAVDRAIAYASMLAEAAGYTVEGAPPGIRTGRLVLPDAYWRAAKQGLRGRQSVLQQVPAGQRQIQRYLKLLTDLDPIVLARAKAQGLTEAQLRPLVGRPAEEQRALVETIIDQGLSSRAADALRQAEPDLEVEELTPEDAPATAPADKRELTLPEEVSRLLRTLTNAVSRYDKLRSRLSDKQLLALLEAELDSYDDTARGSKRANTPRRRLVRLRELLTKMSES